MNEVDQSRFTIEFDGPVGGRRSRGRAGGRPRSRGAGPEAVQDRGYGVPTPPSAPPATGTGTVLRLARGYPPVLGSMLLIDGAATILLGGRAALSAGEIVAYLVLPPVAVLLVGLLTPGARARVPVVAALGATTVALLVALFLGGGVHVATFPGWAEALVGVLLLAVAGATVIPRGAPARQPVEEEPAPAYEEPPAGWRDGSPAYEESPAGWRDGSPAYEEPPAGWPDASPPAWPLAGPADPEWPPATPPHPGRRRSP